MVETRERLRTSQYSGYRVHNYYGTTDVSWAYSSHELTTDIIKTEFDNKPFSVERASKSGGQLYGKQSAKYTGYDWNGYVCTWQASDIAANHHINLPTLDYSQLALDVIKRTNPSKAAVDIMTQVAELKDVPGMLQIFYGLGVDALERAIPLKRWRALAYSAQMYLLYQFGLAPIVDDLNKLLIFQSYVDRRVSELKRLTGRKGLRRTVDLYADSAVSNFNATFHSNGMLVKGPVTKYTTRKITGHIRWYPSVFFDRSDPSMRKLALKTISGNLVDFKTVYELIPWSWLVDYFTNLGDFVSAGRNTVEATHDPVRIMTLTETEVIGRATSTPAAYLTMSDIRNSRHSYTRSIQTPQLSARLEFLTGKQTSILATLGALRGAPSWGGR